MNEFQMAKQIVEEALTYFEDVEEDFPKLKSDLPMWMEDLIHNYIKHFFPWDEFTVAFLRNVLYVHKDELESTIRYYRDHRKCLRDLEDNIDDYSFIIYDPKKWLEGDQNISERCQKCGEKYFPHRRKEFAAWATSDLPDRPWEEQMDLAQWYEHRQMYWYVMDFLEEKVKDQMTTIKH